jgi:hypothetical protein
MPPDRPARRRPSRRPLQLSCPAPRRLRLASRRDRPSPRRRLALGPCPVELRDGHVGPRHRRDRHRPHHELIPHDPTRQAIAGYLYSYIFAHTTNGYPALFALGAAPMLAALAVDLIAGRRNQAS